MRTAEQGLEMRPIPGEPGVDYPVFSEVPDTDFNCRQQEFPGIFTDVESNCQVFHMCQPQSGELNSFLCPNGTMFSQQVRRVLVGLQLIVKLPDVFSILSVTGGITLIAGLRNSLETSTSSYTKKQTRRETARLYFVSMIDHRF